VRSKYDNECRRGFTLVEILIAIAILGILVVLAVGNFGGMNEKYKVEAETKQFYADLMDARGRAMQRNRWFFVRIATTGPGYGYMTYEDRPLPDGDGVFDNTVDALAASVTVRHPIITVLAGGSPNFGFNRNGIANDIGTIRFVSTAQPDYNCITINPTRIKMGQYVGGTCVEK
jgi:prepilin-type N-terminal cleavage/methylation domain-containing protein